MYNEYLQGSILGARNLDGAIEAIAAANTDTVHVVSVPPAKSGAENQRTTAGPSAHFDWAVTSTHGPIAATANPWRGRAAAAWPWLAPCAGRYWPSKPWPSAVFWLRPRLSCCAWAEFYGHPEPRQVTRVAKPRHLWHVSARIQRNAAVAQW